MPGLQDSISTTPSKLSDRPFSLGWQAEGDPGEEAVADRIHFDGVARLRAGLPVSLSRYLQAVPNLENRPEPLDAAIAVSLLHLAASYRPGERTPAETLAAQFPQLRRPIEEAAALNSAIPNTSGILGTLDRPGRSLPAEFGPPLPGGSTTLRYELLSRLGGGAFGDVYLTRDRQLSEEGHPAFVALKILRNQRNQPGQSVRDEATQSRRIDHPAIVRVFDRGVAPSGEDFIVYEYLEGGTLSQMVRARGGRLPPREAAALVADLAGGLAAAHAADVIHCDLKPGNILLTGDGKAKIGDFGVAAAWQDITEVTAANRPSSVVGNLAFISPEQFRRDPGSVTAASDVYALGGMLFWMLTGHLPNGSTAEQISQTHSAASGRREPIGPKDLDFDSDSDLDAITRRALHPDRARRYNTALEFATDLRHWLASEPIPWRSSGPVRRLTLAFRRNPAVVVLLTSVVALIILAAIGSVLLMARSRDLAVQQAGSVAVSRQLLAARAQVQALFADVMRRRRNDRQSEDLPLTEERVRATLDASTGIWTSRFGNTIRLCPRINTQEELATVEDLFWRTEMLCWLVNLGGWAAAEPGLETAIKDWGKFLPPGDSWLADMGTLRLCAAVNRILDQLRPQGDSDAGKALLTEAMQLNVKLRDEAAVLARSGKGQPLHVLVIQKLLLLNGPGCLNDKPEADLYTRQLQEILNAAQVLGVPPLRFEVPASPN